MRTSRGVDRVAVVLVVVAVCAWLVAASGRWSWALAVRGWLPSAALGLTALRGTAPVVRGLVALVAVALTITLAARLATRVRPLVAVVVVLVSVCGSAVLALEAVNGPAYYGDRVTFEVMRPALEQAAEVSLDDVEDDVIVGEPLPWQLAPFSVRGRSYSRDGVVFFPQWTGIPDDAGGFFYSVGPSPEGWDMKGMACEAPERLDDAWWSCGMSPDPGPHW